MTRRNTTPGTLMRQVRRGRFRVGVPARPSHQATVTGSFRWPRMVTRGRGSCESSIELGPVPDGEFLNAMELVFREQEEAGRRRRRIGRGGYSRYRVRQSIQEQNWQLAGGRWSRISATPAGTPDDPEPDLVCWHVPNLVTFDTPGWWLAQLALSDPSRSTVDPDTGRIRYAGQFRFAGGQSSRPDAIVVWVQQNFYTWVEGERNYFGDWVAVSVRYPWQSSLRFERSNPSAAWRPSSASRIQPGHMKMGVTP